MNSLKSLTVGHLLSGMGGTAIGFKEAGFQTVYANEIEPSSAKTFEENLKISVDKKGVQEICVQDLPSFDVLTSSIMAEFLPKHKPFNPFENYSLYHAHRVIQYKKPKVFCFEVTHVRTKTDEQLQWCREAMLPFEEMGYHIRITLLSNQEHGGVPVQGSMFYILGFMDKEQADRFKEVETMEQPLTLKDCLRLEDDQHENYYLDQIFKPSNRYQRIKELIPEEEGVYRLKNLMCKAEELTVESFEKVDLERHNMWLLPSFIKNPNYFIRTKKGVRIPTINEWLAVKGFSSDIEIAQRSARGLKSASQQYREMVAQIGLATCPPLAKSIATAINQTF